MKSLRPYSWNEALIDIGLSLAIGILVGVLVGTFPGWPS